MHRLIALALLSILSPIALASDPSGLLPIMILQVTLLIWPLVLPLLYLGTQKNKLHSYFLFVVFALGSLGILGLPQLLFTNFAAWFAAEEAALRWAIPLNLLKHALAIAFCLWYLPRFRSLLREA